MFGNNGTNGMGNSYEADYGFPARSSYFGIIDLAGFPKDTYYMYQSEWTQKPVLHLFPHWNWLPGQEIDMWCYYNQADEVELFVNGKSQGIRRKTSRLSTSLRATRPCSVPARMPISCSTWPVKTGAHR